MKLFSPKFKRNILTKVDVDFSEALSLAKVLALIAIVLYHFLGDWLVKLNEGLVHLNLVETIFFYASKFGSQGIHIFFLASGFGIAYSELKSRRTGTSFFIRRINRLYPSYLKAVLFSLLLYSIFSNFEFTFLEIVSNLFLLQNFDSELISSINTNWWFVPTILQMYVAYFLLREKLLGSHKLKILLVFFIGSLLYKLSIYISVMQGGLDIKLGGVSPYSSFFLNYFWEFVVGVLLARCIIEKAFKINLLTLIVLFSIGVLLEAIGVYITRYEWGGLFNDDLFFVGVCFIFMSFSLMIVGWTKDLKVLLLKFVAALGGVSYEVYLIHHPISRVVSSYLDYHGVFYLAGLFLFYFILIVLIAKLFTYKQYFTTILKE